MKHIDIIDTTLRDGLQHEEHYMPLEQRLELLNMLIDAGVKKSKWPPLPIRVTFLSSKRSMNLS